MERSKSWEIDEKANIKGANKEDLARRAETGLSESRTGEFTSLRDDYPFLQAIIADDANDGRAGLRGARMS